MSNSRAIVVWEPPAVSLEADVKSAKAWLYAVGRECNRRADLHNDASAALLDKVFVIAECLRLPDDMPLRVRLFNGGDAFTLQA